MKLRIGLVLVGFVFVSLTFISPALATVASFRGLRVPEDVSIIGYDGQHRIAGAMGFEPVSTMVVNWEEMGKSMVDLTMALVLSPKSHVRHIFIPADYEDMGTVAPPRE